MRDFINLNRRISRWLDRIVLPERFVVDGNRYFIDKLARQYIQKGQKIYDVGGGKHPFLTAEERRSLDIHIVGIDISESELLAAAPGAYNEIVVTDIADHKGCYDGDIVICQAVLEHVLRTEDAIHSISTLLKPGGRALIFVPCRNAIFARINLMLPEKWKRKILYTIYPHTRKGQGFHSYYNHCTPREFETIGRHFNMTLEYEYLFYKSSYFEFLLPMYIGWRMAQFMMLTIMGKQAVETFCFVWKKQ